MATDDSERRQILEAVADGSLSPAEAAERLARLEPGGGGQEEAAGGSQTAGGPGAAVGNVRRVRVEVAGAPVEVVADTTLAEPEVRGAHTARREGDTLVVEAEPQGVMAVARAFAGPGGAEGMRRVVRRRAEPLVVRVPPSLAVAVRVSAGSVVVRGVGGPLGVSVSAGSARLEGFTGPLDLEVSAGNVSAEGRLDRGESRVRCSAGSVALRLARGSSVRLRAVAHAGRVSIPGSPAHAEGGAGAGHDRLRFGPEGLGGPWWHSGGFVNVQEAVVGAGRGRLDIEVATGSVAVRADDD